MKVMTIVGTRPELIKLCKVIEALDKNFDHILVHTGQNFDFELNEIFFRDLKIRKPDHFLNCAGKSAVQTIANVLTAAEKVMLEAKPDALLIYGDTNSCYAALAAKRLKIPVFHMEAGNRCFDDRVPEEINRRVIDHISDINMPLTEHARRYLLDEGLPPERVVKTGSCMFEILQSFAPQIQKSKALKTVGVKAEQYFLISCHREETVDSPERLKTFVATLTTLAQKFSKTVVFSIHPRTQKRLDEARLSFKKGFVALKPLGFFDYVHLQKNAFCVISDSGTLMEESAILGFPAVHCREAFERPEGMEHGTLVVSPVEAQAMIEAVKIVTASDSNPKPVPDYQIDDVSRSIVRIIQTYTPAVGRDVWRKI